MSAKQNTVRYCTVFKVLAYRLLYRQTLSNCGASLEVNKPLAIFPWTEKMEYPYGLPFE